MIPKRILVPLDGSPLAEGAIAEAVEIARRHEATLVLLRAVYATTLPAADPTESQVAVVREAEAYLAAMAERVYAAGVAKVETSVWYATATDAITEAARVKKVDLIVMTTHGRTGLNRLMAGSIAESVLRATTTPVLLLRDRRTRGAAPTREAAHV